jgi:hypothetical protein
MDAKHYNGDDDRDLFDSEDPNEDYEPPDREWEPAESPEDFAERMAEIQELK